MKPKKLMALILALSLVLSLAPAWETAAADIDSGLELYYSFDFDRGEPSSVTDGSGNGYNGEALVSAGNIGGFMEHDYRKAVSVQSGVARFPGNEEKIEYPWGATITQYVDGAAIKAPQELKNKLTGSYTVSMWFKADTGYEYHNSLQRLFDFGSGKRESVFLRYNGDGSVGSYRLQDRRLVGTSDGENDVSYISGTSPAAEGGWAMATAVFDMNTKTASIYVNGEIIAEETKDFWPLSSLGASSDSYGLFFGRTQWWKEDFDTKKNNPDFGGWMDEVRVYSRALTAEDVAALYESTYHKPDMKLISSGADISVDVKLGESLELPASLEVTMEDGSAETATVVWDDVPDERLGEIGRFTVRGDLTAGGTRYGKIAAASVTVTAPDSDLSKGLKLYYSFDNDGDRPSEITDDSGSGFNGAVQSAENQGGRPGGGGPSAALTVQSAACGKVASFPGGNRRGSGAAIKIPDAALAGITGDYTVSMWVNADGGYDFADKPQRFFDFGVGDYDSIFARYNAKSGELRFQDRKIRESADDPNSLISATDKSLTDGWGLLTVTYTKADNTADLYVNGRLVASGDKFTRTLGDIGLSSGKYGMYLGRTMWQNADNPDYKGLMDEVRIYDRAISEAEIAELYATTCPENLTEVTIRHELDDGTVIDTKTVRVSDGSSYTYDAPATVEHDGVTYSLYRDKSKLYIDSVDSANNTVTAVYIVKTYEGYSVDGVEAYINTKPNLPSSVTLKYNNGDTERADAEWLDVPENGWGEPGTYTVRGTAGGHEVETTVGVYSITGTDVAETLIVDLGMRPELPSAALAYASNGKTLTSGVLWEPLPEDKIKNNEDFTAIGRLADFPDVEVKTEVRFEFRGNGSVAVEADTYVVEQMAGEAHGGDEQLMLTSTSGDGYAQYDRYVMLRFPKVGMNVESAKLRLYMERINNGVDTDYSLYSFDGAREGDLWDENQLRYMDWYELYMNTRSEEPIATTSFSPDYYQQSVNDWLEFDITDFVNQNAADGDDYYNFYLEASTCATYFSSREGSHPAVIDYHLADNGRIMNVSYVTDSGEAVRTEITPASNAGPFSYGGKPFVKDGSVYVPTQSFYTEAIEDYDSIEIPVAAVPEPLEISPLPEITVFTDESVVLPSSVTVSWNSESLASSGSLELPVTFDETDFSAAGVYDVEGSADGIRVEQRVKAYEPYYSPNGGRSGYASVIYHDYRNADGETIANRAKTVIKQGGLYSGDGEYMEYYPQIKNPVAVGYSDSEGSHEFEPFKAEEPVYHVTVEGELADGVSGRAEASLDYGEDESDESYVLSVGAVAANTAAEAGGARLIVVRFEGGKPSEVLYNGRVGLPADMKNRAEFEPYVLEGYTYDDDIRAYLWESGSVRPLTDVLLASTLPAPTISDEVRELIPEYDDVRENVERANRYYQSNNSYDSRAFWDVAAYETGNMEAYFTFGGEQYREYANNWGSRNNWMGNVNTWTPQDEWTWGYPSRDRNDTTDVLFGDWQICFQTYIDLYMLDDEKNESKIARAEDVMGYQITKTKNVWNDEYEQYIAEPVDDYWWWADALYMVPPIMTKMYLLTGNDEYLEKMYLYYRFAAELMYDGDCGIPNEGEEYTTGAESYKNSHEETIGGGPSDPNNYANLFYRDGKYVYPLGAINGTKNFWARGNGWVFAGLAKILSDVPTDYEHRDYFENLYLEMAKAIIDCQHVDDEGRGFWTQSMLADYPKGSNGNSWGYETSGTAFFTYGLFWGLNSGLLSEREYLEPALRGWKYLSEIALQESGKVGYCQEIGSNATQATPDWRDQPFGYGAFLLAGCELSRYVGGVTENNGAYLKRRLWGASAACGGKYYKDGAVIDGPALMTDAFGELWIPLDGLETLLGGRYMDNGDGTVLVTFGENSQLVDADDLTEEDGAKYLRGSLALGLSGKHASVYGAVTVFSHKAADDLFYDCDEKAIEYLQALLG